MRKNRIIIAGSRSCPESDDNLHLNCLNLLKDLNRDSIEIISGTCRGADKFGEWFAKSLELPIKMFPADWDKQGKAAGFIRNKKMAEYGTHLIALWDGSSKGTWSMIKLAKKYNLKIRIINI